MWKIKLSMNNSINQKNKTRRMFLWSDLMGVDIEKNQSNFTTNQNNIIRIKNPNQYFSKKLDLSTDWINLELRTSKQGYCLFETVIDRIPNLFISNIESEIIIRSWDGQKTFVNTGGNTSKLIEIEDTIPPNSEVVDPDYPIKKIKYSHVWYASGQDELEGIQTKVLCYVFPGVETVR
jgi:hypothetical protein